MCCYIHAASLRSLPDTCQCLKFCLLPKRLLFFFASRLKYPIALSLLNMFKTHPLISPAPKSLSPCGLIFVSGNSALTAWDRASGVGAGSSFSHTTRPLRSKSRPFYLQRCFTNLTISTTLPPPPCSHGLPSLRLPLREGIDLSVSLIVLQFPGHCRPAAGAQDYLMSSSLGWIVVIPYP